ncbi:MAG TPA: hypothetical protein VE631_10890 [Alphaproteobacteria bacterium]|nr:hypothetical protein [Alphaproteobacteria bacterium]
MARQRAAGRQDLPRHEELLLDYAERLRRHVKGRRAVHVHLAALQPHHRRPHHIRMAASTFDALVKRYEGQCFQLQNADIVVVVRGAGVQQIDEVILKLRYLFSGDPLVAQEASGGRSGKTFCTWYDLEKDYAGFLAIAQRMHARAGDPLAAAPPANDDEETEAPAEPSVPLDVRGLARLEKLLASTDIAALHRRQTVCAVAPGREPQPVFNEVYVSIEELRRRMVPEIDLLANRWLFQHLTEVLDSRMLRQLPELERSEKLSTSLNLNLSTVLSEQFLAFDRSLREYVKKAMVIELQCVDVFGDIGAYQFARDFLRNRGYRICLDGLNYLTFPLLARRELDFDFQKIIWAPDLAEAGTAGSRGAFLDALRAADPSRVILCRCDDSSAIRFGQQHGIVLFQGRAVDRLLGGAERG